ARPPAADARRPSTTPARRRREPSRCARCRENHAATSARSAPPAHPKRPHRAHVRDTSPPYEPRIGQCAAFPHPDKQTTRSGQTNAPKISDHEPTRVWPVSGVPTGSGTSREVRPLLAAVHTRPADTGLVALAAGGHKHGD